MDTDFSLYHAAIAADDAYTDAIHRVYGVRVTRWTLPKVPHATVVAAFAVKVAADTAWLAEMRRTS